MSCKQNSNVIFLKCWEIFLATKLILLTLLTSSKMGVVRLLDEEFDLKTKYGVKKKHVGG
jgi:hypothetical protein